MTPVVCLPGLTRTVRDLHLLATALASDPEWPRRVVSFDYRGRGASDRDPDPAHYQPPIELADVLAGVASRGVKRAAIVGTSRGGILTMLMSGVRPDLIAGAVLVDIGSRIETAGLLRIKSYVGALPPPRDWAEATATLRSVHGVKFPAYGPEDWAEFARLTYRDDGGKPVGDSDPALATTLAGVTEEMPPIDLSAAFATLSAVPVMVIRGETSDLLSPETVEAMAAAHPGLEVVVAEGEGHPPMLRGRLAAAIADFIGRLDHRL